MYGPVRVPRHQHALPRRQRLVELGADLVGAAAAATRCRAAAAASCGSMLSASISFSRTRDRFFELERIGSHGAFYRQRQRSFDGTRPPHRLLDFGDAAARDGRTRIGDDTSARTRSGRAPLRSSSSSETRRSPRCRAKTSASASNVVRPCGGVSRRMATSRGRARGAPSIGSDLASRGAARVSSSRLELAAHEHHRVVLDRGAATCWNVSGSTTTSTPPCVVFEHERRPCGRPSCVLSGRTPDDDAAASAHRSAIGRLGAARPSCAVRAERLQVRRRSGRSGGRSCTGRAPPSRTRAAACSVQRRRRRAAAIASRRPRPSPPSSAPNSCDCPCSRSRWRGCRARGARRRPRAGARAAPARQRRPASGRAAERVEARRP